LYVLLEHRFWGHGPSYHRPNCYRPDEQANGIPLPQILRKTKAEPKKGNDSQEANHPGNHKERHRSISCAL
jgi:hypothetical protein